METNKPFLSICIPAYNRINELKKLVLNIFSLPLHNIEVVVLDNCSTDNTLDILKTIKDERLSVYSNTENIGGELNHLKVLQLGKGIYSLFCIDRDWLNVEYLSNFINILQQNMDVDLGYCALDITNEAEPVFFNSGVDSIINFSYVSKHPTGYFYKTEKYKSLEILNRLSLDKDKYNFFIEIINAELAYHGKGAFIPIPLFTPCHLKDKDYYAKNKSNIINNDNFFGSPNLRIIEYGKYFMHMSTLPLSKNDKKKIMGRVVMYGLYRCTIEYKNTMKIELFVQHYQLEQKKISIIDYIYYGYNYYKSFFSLNIKMNFIEKFIFLLEQHLYYSFKIICLLFQNKSIMDLVIPQKYHVLWK
jgi:glycosyltransferase involved in cell wall biosynthesis